MVVDFRGAPCGTVGVVEASYRDVDERMVKAMLSMSAPREGIWYVRLQNSKIEVKVVISRDKTPATTTRAPSLKHGTDKSFSPSLHAPEPSLRSRDSITFVEFTRSTKETSERHLILR